VCVCVYWLTRVVPEKGPLNSRVRACMCTNCNSKTHFNTAIAPMFHFLSSLSFFAFCHTFACCLSLGKICQDIFRLSFGVFCCLSPTYSSFGNWTGKVVKNKKLSYRRGTTRCVVSVEILPFATQQCRNYTCTTSPEQIEVM